VYPTYQGLTRYAETAGGYVHWVDLDEAMKHDLQAMDLRTTQRVSLVFVCNPNNPTGTLLDPATLRDFCMSTARRTFVFVDEAYNELTDDPAANSMVGLVHEGHNVLIARTFSKIHGMAGLRIGYGIARPDIIERISQFRMGGPNVLALHAAAASYQDAEFQTFSRKKVAEARQFTYGVLDEVGYRYIPSETNFIFFHTGRDIADFQTAMQDQGVLVGRPFPPYRDWCRVSMGTDENMQAFADALRRVV
jgi:histidinol-phosphate aminotransferase